MQTGGHTTNLTWEKRTRRRRTRWKTAPDTWKHYSKRKRKICSSRTEFLHIYICSASSVEIWVQINHLYDMHTLLTPSTVLKSLTSSKTLQIQPNLTWSDQFSEKRCRDERCLHQCSGNSVSTALLALAQSQEKMKSNPLYLYIARNWAGEWTGIFTSIKMYTGKICTNKIVCPERASRVSAVVVVAPKSRDSRHTVDTAERAEGERQQKQERAKTQHAMRSNKNLASHLQASEAYTPYIIL